MLLTMAKILPDPRIDQCILTLRGYKVVLDSDLAEIYGVPTKRLNEQVSRNRKKFPADFAFRLTDQESKQIPASDVQQTVRIQLALKKSRNLRSQIATSSSEHGGRRYLPYVFTEHGALQAANVLNSPRATTMSIRVIRAFVKLREHLAINESLRRHVAEIDQSLLDP